MAQKYQRLTPIEHILKRPDMYVGSTLAEDQSHFVAISPDEIEYVVKVKVSEAIIRIFTEPLSNAIDNALSYPGTTKISVKVDPKTGSTTIINDGRPIPVERNKDGEWIHTMIFGQLLTGSNYDDSGDRFGSGRNGLGVKLTNVFSKEFKVVGQNGTLQLTQEWSRNMRDTTGATVIRKKVPKPKTMISYTPDFEKVSVGIKCYCNIVMGLFRRMIIDTALSLGITTTFNDEKYRITSLRTYAFLYGGGPFAIINTDLSSVVITPLENRDEPQVVSFVNGVFTRDGGEHVDAWLGPLVKHLLLKLNGKSGTLTPRDIKTFASFVRKRKSKQTRI